MASNIISILIQAKDSASQVLSGVTDSIDKNSKKVQQQGGVLENIKQNWVAYAGLAAGAGVATHSLAGYMDESISSANRLQAALTGLNSVATAFHQDADGAKRAAQDLASDGLLTVADAATGLKNLLASGFSLDQAIVLMKRFKDSAAFGRQSALTFGQAVSSATEGIKNGNSILVDNAGVTKNLSIILKEAGFAEQDLMLATTNASVRQALFNGILKETNPQLGDAAKLADSAAGKQAVLAAQTEILRQKVGLALQPALLSLLQVVTPIITTLADWVSKNPELASTLLIGTTAVIGLTAAAGSLGLAMIGLGPVFTLFAAIGTSSIGTVGVAFRGLSAIVATPMVMPAIAVAAAVAAIATVYNEYQKTMNAIEQRNESVKQKVASDQAVLNQMIATVNDVRSTPAQREQAKKVINSLSGRASGGPVSAGTTYLVGEHGPEPFTPSVSGTITPTGSTSGNGVHIEHVTINNNADINRLARELSWRLAIA